MPQSRRRDFRKILRGVDNNPRVSGGREMRALKTPFWDQKSHFSKKTPRSKMQLFKTTIENHCLPAPKLSVRCPKCVRNQISLIFDIRDRLSQKHAFSVVFLKRGLHWVLFAEGRKIEFFEIAQISAIITPRPYKRVPNIVRTKDSDRK